MKRLNIVAFSLGLVFALTRCSDPAPGPDVFLSPPSGLIASNPVATGANNQANAERLLFQQTNDMSYISASPGTFPSAVSATIVNRTIGGQEIAIRFIDGGFDPVALKAHEGDEVLLTVAGASGSRSIFLVKVPPKRPPNVVRTSPSKGRIDVALSVQVLIVFSEPISPSSVSDSSISLMHNGKPVTGTVTLSDDALSAQFTPVAPLEPQANYVIFVGRGIRDASGDALDQESTTEFTTIAQAPTPAGLGFVSVSLLDSATQGPLMELALLRVSATPINGGGSETIYYGRQTRSSFTSGGLGAGRWKVTISAVHTWNYVFPGLSVYRDTTVIVDVTAGETTAVPAILLRPRAPLLLIGVNSCPWSRPDPLTFDDWADCDSGYWGGVVVEVDVKGVQGTPTSGEHFHGIIGGGKYDIAPVSWLETSWSTGFNITIPGDYDLTVVSVNSASSFPTRPWRLVPWEESMQRVTVANGLAYVGLDFWFH